MLHGQTNIYIHIINYEIKYHVANRWKKDVITKKFSSVFLFIMISKLSCKTNTKTVTSRALRQLLACAIYIPCKAYEASLTARSFEHCKYPPKIENFN